MPYSMQLTEQIPDDPPRIGAKVLLLAIIRVPLFMTKMENSHYPSRAQSGHKSVEDPGSEKEGRPQYILVKFKWFSYF